MRKLKLQMQISVDGYVANPDGGQDWTVESDEKLWQFMNEVAGSSDTLLLGRKNGAGLCRAFRSIQARQSQIFFAQKMVNFRRIVFTKTLDKPFGINTSLAKGNLADEVAKLKNENGSDIFVYGGAGLVSARIAGGHIDGFLFFVNPVMINKGMRIFDLLEKRQQLLLVNATPYECGITVLHYK